LKKDYEEVASDTHKGDNTGGDEAADQQQQESAPETGDGGAPEADEY